MIIIQPYAKIIWPFPAYGTELLRKIEWVGRISHRSEELMTRDSYLNFIRHVVLEHGDWSIVEHASVTVDAVVDRGTTHEIVRHQLFTYTQEINYEEKMPPRFIKPLELRERYRASLVWERAIECCGAGYRELLAAGCEPQLARTAFPNSLASRIIITGNLRNWRHFLIMYTTKEAYPQVREVTIPLLEEFKNSIPLLFDDIEPLEKQSIAIKKAR